MSEYCHCCNAPDEGYHVEDAYGHMLCEDCEAGDFFCEHCNYYFPFLDLSEIENTCIHCAEYLED